MPKDLLPWDKELRKWQNSAWGAYLQSNKDDFLVVATPGSGKTTFALRVAHGMLSSEQINRIVIVCPTEHLKKQWTEAAAKVGIDLDYEFANSDGREASDYHGVVVTYHQIASSPDLHRANASRTATLVILDEIHHAADELSWGNALRSAFGPAKRRLLLSGTPFRTDQNRIPFVVYEPLVPGGWGCVPNFSYGYGDALTDGGVCRDVFFPSYDGNMSWLSRSGDLLKASFGELLSETQDAERLKTALAPTGEYIQGVLRDANSKLNILREEHPHAGGLIIAIDQRHAREIASQLAAITNEQIVLVVSDDPDASNRIEKFAHGHQPWIVAVKMVSEGVDIPRLRICVYATNVVTEMYFRQAAGRVIRWMQDLADTDQSAYFYIPKHRRLVELALQIQEERFHQLEDVVRDLRREEQSGERKESDTQFQPISSDGWQDGVIFAATEYPQTSIDRAQRYMQRLGFPPNYEATLIARLLDVAAADGLVPVTTATKTTTGPTLTDRKGALRKTIGRLVAEYREKTGGGNIGERNKEIYYKLNNVQGVTQDKATERQLIDRAKILQQWIDGLG